MGVRALRLADDLPLTAPSEQQLAAVSGLFLAVSQPKRLQMLWLLAQQEQDVTRLAEQVELALSTTSYHLKILRAAGVIGARCEGRNVVHFVTDECLVRSLLAVARLSVDAGGRNVRPADARTVSSRA
jgi:DNA-binding transcriptional ArsR family regulator